MPYAAGRPCRHPGCPEVVTARDGLCELHRKQQHRHHQVIRTDQGSQRLYQSTRWHRLRKTHLVEQPFCEVCGVPAEMVHHRVEHGGDPGLFFSPSNLCSLCKACHNALHTRGAVAQQQHASR